MGSFDVAPKSTVEPIFAKMYASKQGDGVMGERVDCQRLALLFIIFAMGSLHSLELPPNDPSAEEYLDLAKRSLAKTDFLTHSTVAGVQTLVSNPDTDRGAVYSFNHSISWLTTICTHTTKHLHSVTDE